MIQVFGDSSYAVGVSALDKQSDWEIKSELAELMWGRTVMAIAHRLSTVSILIGGVGGWESYRGWTTDYPAFRLQLIFILVAVVKLSRFSFSDDVERSTTFITHL